MSSGEFDRTPKTVPLVNTKYRKIVTQIPVPESLSIMEDLDKYESRSMHGQYPIVWQKAKGCQVYDYWGNIWLDFTSTIFVTNSGHGNPAISKAIKEVADKPLLHAYNYYTKERADYIKYLIENTPANFEKAFLLSAGTEATECALKLMRVYGQKINKRHLGVICWEGAWHGRTLGAQMMGYNAQQKDWIGYQDPNIYHLPYPYPWREKAMKDPEKYFNDSIDFLIERYNLNPETDLCGMMIESAQGWAATFYPKEYIKAAEKFAKKYNLLMTFDEMQTGFGRTGKLFGYMHYDVEPDLICCGKGAGSSLPLSFVLGSAEIMDLPDVGSMSSTHSASPLVCSAGLANFKTILEDGLIENSRVLGELLINELNKLKDRFPNHISNICGNGLYAAIHFKDPEGNYLLDLCKEICEKLLCRGLLVVYAVKSIKVAPALTITEEALIEGLAVMKETISECIN